MFQKKLLLDIKPVAWARPRVSKWGGFFTEKRVAEYLEIIKTGAKHSMLGITPHDGAVSLKIRFNFTRGKTVERVCMTTKPDLDNLVKAIMDALNGIWFKDDSQVVTLFCSKAYDTHDSIEILGIFY